MTVSDRKIYSIKLGRDRVIELGRRTLIMGILNITPDSFSDGGLYHDYDRALARATELINDGADILDVGGESTRPGSAPTPAEVELERVLPIIRAVRKISDIPISIDTAKAQVADKALEAGADIINDISSLRFDPDMVRVAAGSGAPLILMHMLGTPETMQVNPVYQSVISEIIAFLEERMGYAVKNGVERSRIIVDPGIGFGKTPAHNLKIIRDLDSFSCMDRPILLAASRKRFLGALTGHSEMGRELGTAIADSFGICAGAHMIRVHDVAFHREAVMVADALREAI
ncbi:MAG: dihydropteroate synthase [Syntrophobacteraceae bacterium]